MRHYGVNELREMFLAFFKERGHLIVESASLIPRGDNSLLLINAGMAPLKPYFTGQEIPENVRMVSCQKCVRTGDIENVGKTARHLTFFEMLGNFSFGDYFKREAISWSFEFLTEVLGLDRERLYPSVYGEDDEAFAIWRDEIGVPAEKIKRFYREEDGSCDNFWEHGAGPCGPCSEIYYDRGEHFGCGSENCGVGCDCDRYMEVWNNVFTQFDGDGKGHYTELESKNIDTGMGLERLAVVMQEVGSVFDIDTVKAIRDEVCAKAGKAYLKNEKDNVSIRLITDHLRSAVFLISDGVMPSNEGRGYVLRRLIRRAARHGKMLGMRGNFLSALADIVIAQSGDAYPQLREKYSFIKNVLTQEEEKFSKTIDQGLSILAQMEEVLRQKGEALLSGEDAFRLYDTYGFPIDLTDEILAEHGMSTDRAGFLKAMEAQKKRARDARRKTNYMGAEATVYDTLDSSVTTEFAGYDKLVLESVITAAIRRDDESKTEEIREELSKGESGALIVPKTPFYPTMGGQRADAGYITTEEGEFAVVDTLKLPANRMAHCGTVTRGVIRQGYRAKLSVDAGRRGRTACNHSATHLLQKALRIVLGDHVEQAGSDVSAERLRFDFSHFAAMTDKQLQETERIVNEKIAEALPVVTEIMDLDEAKEKGAMALFGEKYAQRVRVVKMGDFSIELCGGTHVTDTGRIQAFKILSEQGIAAGVRRIEAITKDAVFEHYEKAEKALCDAAALLKVQPEGLTEKIAQLKEQCRQLQSKVERLERKAVSESIADLQSRIEEIKGIKLITAAPEDADMEGLCRIGDELKAGSGDAVIVLASSKKGKVSLLAMATDKAVGAGAHAGDLIRAIAGKVDGGGGGRPGMARAGGKNPEGIPDALSEAAKVLEDQLK